MKKKKDTYICVFVISNVEITRTKRRKRGWRKLLACQEILGHSKCIVQLVIWLTPKRKVYECVCEPRRAFALSCIYNKWNLLHSNFIRNTNVLLGWPVLFLYAYIVGGEKKGDWRLYNLANVVRKRNSRRRENRRERSEKGKKRGYSRLYVCTYEEKKAKEREKSFPILLFLPSTFLCRIANYMCPAFLALAFFSPRAEERKSHTYTHTGKRGRIKNVIQ